ncbi:integrase, catalytic region, zinc finger, CCHC-type containing protein [Tanacetum coccineum]
MHTIGMTMKPLQVNTKFINHLQPEWSKCLTDVKLAKDMHTTNFDHLYAHLRQHEAHANEVRLARQRYPDQVALVANSPSCFNPTQYYLQLSSASQQYYPSPTPQPPAIPQLPLELNSRLIVPSFKTFDDPVDNLNKLMAFIEESLFRKFKGDRHKDMLTIRAKNTAINPSVNRQGVAVQPRVVKCYNCQEESHFARQYTKPKRLRTLHDNGDTIILAQVSQEIPTPVAFQTDDLDTFDSDCDNVPSA